MILSDVGLKKAIKKGHIKIVPAPADDHFKTSAVDLLLGDSFKLWNVPSAKKVPGYVGHLDVSEQSFPLTADQFSKDATPEPDGSFIIEPYSDSPQIVLCQTQATITLEGNARLAARVEGRSSLARLGLMVHLTAPTIHAGFRGRITLEVINHGPFRLKLTPNKTIICQLIVEKLAEQPGRKIDTIFQDQIDPTGKKAPASGASSASRHSRPRRRR